MNEKKYSGNPNSVSLSERKPINQKEWIWHCQKMQKRFIQEIWQNREITFVNDHIDSDYDKKYIWNKVKFYLAKLLVSFGLLRRQYFHGVFRIQNKEINGGIPKDMRSYSVRVKNNIETLNE